MAEPRWPASDRGWTIVQRRRSDLADRPIVRSSDRPVAPTALTAPFRSKKRLWGTRAGDAGDAAAGLAAGARTARSRCRSRIRAPRRANWMRWCRWRRRRRGTVRAVADEFGISSARVAHGGGDTGSDEWWCSSWLGTRRGHYRVAPVPGAVARLARLPQLRHVSPRPQVSSPRPASRHHGGVPRARPQASPSPARASPRSQVTSVAGGRRLRRGGQRLGALSPRIGIPRYRLLYKSMPQFHPMAEILVQSTLGRPLTLFSSNGLVLVRPPSAVRPTVRPPMSTSDGARPTRPT